MLWPLFPAGFEAAAVTEGPSAYARVHWPLKFRGNVELTGNPAVVPHQDSLRTGPALWPAAQTGAPGMACGCMTIRFTVDVPVTGRGSFAFSFSSLRMVPVGCAGAAILAWSSQFVASTLQSADGCDRSACCCWRPAAGWRGTAAGWRLLLAGGLCCWLEGLLLAGALLLAGGAAGAGAGRCCWLEGAWWLLEALLLAGASTGPGLQVRRPCADVSTSHLGDHEQGGAMQPRCHPWSQPSEDHVRSITRRCTCHATSSSSSSPAGVATPDEVATPPDGWLPPEWRRSQAAATLHTSAHLSLRDLRSPIPLAT
jgi:hypothetical protein